MRNDPSLGELLAVDPSIRSAGAALFRGGVLAAATCFKIEPVEDETPVTRCLRMAHDIVDWVAGNHSRPRIFAVEWPGTSWRGDARDLHGLCGVAGAVAGILSLAMAMRAPLETISYDVNEWSGSLPKETTVRNAKKSQRALYIARRLTNAELEIWSMVKYHDTIDAIGIGLHCLGRMDPVRVFPGASMLGSD